MKYCPLERCEWRNALDERCLWPGEWCPRRRERLAALWEETLAWCRAAGAGEKEGGKRGKPGRKARPGNKHSGGALSKATGGLPCGGRNDGALLNVAFSPFGQGSGRAAGSRGASGGRAGVPRLGGKPPGGKGDAPGGPPAAAPFRPYRSPADGYPGSPADFPAPHRPDGGASRPGHSPQPGGPGKASRPGWERRQDIFPANSPLSVIDKKRKTPYNA